MKPANGSWTFVNEESFEGNRRASNGDARKGTSPGKKKLSRSAARARLSALKREEHSAASKQSLPRQACHAAAKR